MKSMIIDVHPKRVAVGIVEDGELKEYRVERATAPKLVGNVYKGRVVNTLAGMKAAFVNIGLEKNAFLSVGEAPADGRTPVDPAPEVPEILNVSPGDRIMCQIVKDTFGTKGVRISQNVSLPGRFLVMTPRADHVAISRKIEDEDARNRLLELVNGNRPKGIGFIVRTAAASAEDEEITDEMKSLYAKWEGIAGAYAAAGDGEVLYEEGDLIFRTIRDFLDPGMDRVIVSSPVVYRALKERLPEVYGSKEVVELYEGAENIFSYYNVKSQVDKLVRRRVTLKNGSYIVIDTTEALTVIDVNTGKYVGENDLEKTFLKTNFLAAEEIARQLRLRNIGGIIIVDFIGMALPESRERLLAALEAELSKDRIHTSKPIMTRLGLVEFTRKKTRENIYGLLLKECPYCQGDGYIFSEEYVIESVREAVINLFAERNPSNVLITVHPDVFAKLFSLRYLERECATIWKGKRIYVIPDASLHHEKFSIDYNNEIVLTLPGEAKLLY